MVRKLAIAALAIGVFAGVSACTDSHGGVGLGYAAPPGYYAGGPYGDGYGYDPYAYAYGDEGYGYGPSYFGWYGGFYYPGVGIYVYDRYHHRHSWTYDQAHYWQGRQHDRGAGYDGRANWRGFANLGVTPGGAHSGPFHGGGRSFHGGGGHGHR